MTTSYGPLLVQNLILDIELHMNANLYPVMHKLCPVQRHTEIICTYGPLLVSFDDDRRSRGGATAKT